MEVDAREKEPLPDSEGEGDDLRPGAANANVDSSEEESEGSEAEREVREGFIVDEDDGERRKKRKRKHKRKPTEDKVDEQLDDDDLDLIGQGPSSAPQFKRLRRFREDSVGSDDLDKEDTGGNNLRIFDDDEVAPAAAGDYEDEMDGFIELDPEEQAIEDAQRQGRAQAAARGKAGLQGAMPGMARETMEDIQEIFGTGEEYAWAMELDEVDTSKGAPKFKDVFEPAIISERMMTDEDDLIRARDVPERMQMLAARHLGKDSPFGRSQPLIDDSDFKGAVEWLSSRISPRLTDEYLRKDQYGNFISRYHREYLEAIEHVLDEMHTKFREVPFIWMHRRDFITFQDPSGQSVQLLDRPDLWKIQALSYQYRSILDRKISLNRLWNKLGTPSDNYFNDCYNRIEGLEEATELSEWVNTRFVKELRAIRQREEDADALENGIQNGQKFKKAARIGPYERAKDSHVAALADEMAVETRVLIQAFATDATSVFKEDPPMAPEEYAEQFVMEGSPFSSPEVVLTAAKTILIQDLKSDPYLRREIRRRMHLNGVLTIRPTEKGRIKIDEHHPYAPFKYVDGKPYNEAIGQPQFLAMVAAEAEGLITLEIGLPIENKRELERGLKKIYLSDYTSHIAQEWNGIREDVLKVALENHIMPSIADWMRKRLKDEAEDAVLKVIQQKLENQVEVAPFQNGRMEKGDTPSVVAVSFGAGDPRHDNVIAVSLDSAGRFRDQLKVDSIIKVHPMAAEREPARAQARVDDQKAFLDFLDKNKPDVVVVGGFSFATKNLFHATQELVSKFQDNLETSSQKGLEYARTRTIYVNDSTARLYQHSKRATDEFPQLATLAKYCVGLARYTQNTMLEYAALGDQITTITFDRHQKYIDEERTRLALHQVLVNYVNYVGVDINRALRDPYYASLLPHVGGLGPRKAQGLVKAIRQIGETLVCRADMLAKHILTENIFMSSAAFLYIDQSFVEGNARDGEEGPDVLDSTRIHSEDYDIARKMASDAEELDEEDIAALSHPSEAVRQLMEGDANKLAELRLDDFAVELQRIMEVPKRITLYLIREELITPYGETRIDFKPLTDTEAFQQISGETPETFGNGLVVPVVVTRPAGSNSFMKVRLESGLEGIVPEGRIFESEATATTFTAGQALRAVITGGEPRQLMEDEEEKTDWKEVLVQLDTRPATIASAELQSTIVEKNKRDKYYDTMQEASDATTLEAAKKKAQGRQRRLIQHRNFHNFNAGAAEHYLASQPRGECVIRPSSLGTDHLACTWKVAEGVYAHLQINELNKPDGNPLALGTLLQIGGKYKYADLDELIYSHVRSMANKVEEMMAHEKFKGTDEELLTFLRNFQMANPDKPAYGFSIDKKHPGQFNLTFITAKGGQPRTWPVKVSPGSFNLFEAESLPDIRSLCNAFKLQYSVLLTQNGGPGPSGRTPASRTPYGRNTPAGRSTPAYTGYAASSRTPNQYTSIPYR